MLQISKYDPDFHCTGFLDNTSRCSNSLKRFSIPNITYLLFVKNQNFVLYQMTGKASQVPWLIGETSHDEHCRRILIKSLAGFWWGVLGKLHHWRITQVQIRTTSQNIICPKLSPAATLETKRTLTSGWNDWLQGFLEPMRKIPQKWEFLQQKKTLHSFKYLHRSSVIRNRWKMTPWKNCTGFAGVSSAHHTSYQLNSQGQTDTPPGRAKGGD